MVGPISVGIETPEIVSCPEFSIRRSIVFVIKLGDRLKYWSKSDSYPPIASIP
jgi:hypothetical protein